MNIPSEWAWRMYLKSLSSMNERAERAEDKVAELELSEKIVRLALALRSFGTLPPVPSFLASMPEGEEKYRSFCAVVERFCASKSRSEQKLLNYKAKQRTRRKMIDAYFATMAKLCVFMRYGTLRAMESSAANGSLRVMRGSFTQLQMFLSSSRFG